MDNRPRLLGLDYGDASLGVAVSDPTGKIAFGLETIRRTSARDLRATFSRLQTLVAEYRPAAFVLGWPKNMDNTEGTRCAKTRDFQRRLQKVFPHIPVYLRDERLTTVGARYAIGRRTTNTPLKKIVDEVAAALILQRYLEEKMKEPQPQSGIAMRDEHGQEHWYQFLAWKADAGGTKYYAAESDGELSFFQCVSENEDTDEMVLDRADESEFDTLLALFAPEFEALEIDVE